MPPGHELPEPDAERWRELLADPAVTLLAAEEAGELLGFAVCGESRDPDAGPQAGELRAFFVASERWGRGVGRALMDAALADLRRRGYAEATLWSFAGNERANGFYESHGFERDGTERSEEVWAGIAQARYRRRLR